MNLFIYGSRGAAVETYDMVIRNNYYNHKYSGVFFVDDFMDENVFYGTRRIHFDSINDLAGNSNKEIIIAVGEPSVRKLLFDRVKRAGMQVATLVDRSSVISESAIIKEGCIINANAIVSSEAIINENCIVMFQAIVGHHANVGKHCVICPQATVGGFNNVGDESFFGLGSHVIQHVDVGSKSIVGLGAVAFKSIGSDTVVVGNPARITKGNNSGVVFAQSKNE